MIAPRHYAVAGADLADLRTRPGYRGRVEGLADGVISGWCLSTLEPAKPVRLELWIGEAKLCAFATGEGRADIEGAVGLPVRPGFRARVLRSERQTTAEMLTLLLGAKKAGRSALDLMSVRVSGKPIALEFSPYLNISFDELALQVTKPRVLSADLDDLDNGGPFRGYVDGLFDGVLSGWCVDIGKPGDKLALEVYYKNVLMGATTTGVARDDISRAVGSPSAAGFAFGPQDMGGPDLPALLTALSSPSQPSHGRNFAVRIAGLDYFLPSGANFELSESDVRRYSAAAAGKLAELSKNKRIERTQELMAAPAKTAPQSPAAQEEQVRVVAFYLPQFHPFPENEEWWGAGFTEWTNVASARPNFQGHNQPRAPADLGYYDLRLDLVHEKQVELARRHRISGFCYYYYWFAGKTLMTMAVDRHLDRNYELDFCLCWANENWSRRWDGSEDDVLMQQSHTKIDDDNFIDEIIKYFHSPRYIKIDGAPLLIVYRVPLLSNPSSTIKEWKRKVRAAGFPDLHVCVCETFGLNDPTGFGADSSCQFPPHGIVAKEIQSRLPGLDGDFTGKVYDYVETAANEVWRPDPPFLRFRTAMPAWDNTSRKGKAAHVFHNASPAAFEAWLSVLCAKARRNLSPDRRLVFVNAWNEWAEGAYLEPDRHDGQRNLKAVRAAVSSANLLLGDLLAAPPQEGSAQAELVRLVSSLANANRRLMEFASDYCAGPSVGPSPFVAVPEDALHRDAAQGGACHIETLDGKTFAATEITVDRARKTTLAGWVFAPNIDLKPGLPVFFHLTGSGGAEYVASLFERFAREDVAAAYQKESWQQYYGFNSLVDFAAVAPGAYRLQFLLGSIHRPNAAYFVPSSLTFVVG